MDIELNYRNKRRYNTAKYPIRQPLYLTWLIWILSKFALIGKDYKVEKVNMEGLKPPHMILSNHMSFFVQPAARITESTESRCRPTACISNMTSCG